MPSTRHILSRWLLAGCLTFQGIAAPAATEDAGGPTDTPADCISERVGRRGVPRLCVRTAHYASDLCAAIERLSSERDLPADFFARLIWRESLFRADAVSPKGAEGIAQFMPGTAKLRGLVDSFDVVPALEASARYLDDLRARFGNLGLAAAAYNAGENRLSSFLRSGRLPLETRDYVFAITGQPVETWRDDPPQSAAAALDPDRPFHAACLALAKSRNLRQPVLVQSGDWAPWGVQLAASFDPAMANRLMQKSVSRFPAALASERPIIVRQRRPKPGMRPKYQARIGRDSRQEALSLCDRIRAAGVACAVVKN